MRLIVADNEEEALQKAYEIGRQEEECFYNVAEKLVQWKFINVAELFRIAGLIDGAEIYSKIEEKENGELYTEMIHKRAAGLRENSGQYLLQAF